MENDFKRLTDFLVSLGTEDVPHSGKAFLAHLIAVYRDLERWGCDAELCRAGMFHSIYGTELFRTFALPVERRSEVRELIGDRAERIAYVNCMMDRASFDALIDTDGPYRFRNRVTDETIELDREDYDDLCRVHLCDWLEQVERSNRWDYRRESFRKLADRLGGVAREEYERVFANEPVSHGD